MGDKPFTFDTASVAFPKEPTLSPKAYRESAVVWQLRALHAQTEAVAAIAAEHGINIQDIDPHNLVQRAEDLVAGANQICQSAGKLPVEKTFEAIKVLRQLADSLRADTALFVRVADFRAAFRLSGMLPALAEKLRTGIELIASSDQCGGDQKTDKDAVGEDGRKLALASARRCFKAESEQHSTFSLQVNAICDLVMEMVLAAAAEASPTKD